MTDEAIRIRQVQPGDLDDLSRICLLTADDGEDATGLYRDPRLPGHLYVAPYAIFEPSLAFVAEDGEGPGGYTVAALDTAAFERRLERDWWAGLRARFGEPPASADGISEAERQARHIIRHPWRSAPELAGTYPSHLHIDLVPRLRGRSAGRRLIATLTAALSAQGSRGVRLSVGQQNERAPGFYRHVGFRQLPADNVRIFVMGLTSPG